jgi:hypothetical protein
MLMLRDNQKPANKKTNATDGAVQSAIDLNQTKPSRHGHSGNRGSSEIFV